MVDEEGAYWFIFGLVGPSKSIPLAEMKLFDLAPCLK